MFIYPFIKDLGITTYIIVGINKNYFFRLENNTYFCKSKYLPFMEYDEKDKLEWTLIFASVFGQRFGLTLKQAFNYLSRYQGIDFIDRHYGYVHTQSFQSMVDDIGEYCHRKGGALA